MIIALHRSPESGPENVVIKHIPQVIHHIIKFFELQTVKSLEAKPKKSMTSTILPTSKAHDKNQVRKNRRNSTIPASADNRVAGQIWRAQGPFSRRACNAGPLFPSSPGRGRAGAVSRAPVAMV